MWSHVATVVGTLATVSILYAGTHTGLVKESAWGQAAQRHRGSMRSPMYRNTVMPNGQCNVSAQDGLPAAFPYPDYTHVIPIAVNPHYGGHIVVLGRDGKLYHKYQRSAGLGGNWTEFKCLTPDLTKVPCSAAPNCHGYDNNPVIAVQPKDGTLVVFVRQMDDLDIHEMHLADPKNPESWTPMRAPTCLCNFPPCVDKGQTKCGTEANCDNKGVDCSDHEHRPSSPKYWASQPCFPTSELSLLADQEGKLNLFFRGFDGNLYMTRQGTAGDAMGKYEPPVMYGLNAEVE